MPLPEDKKQEILQNLAKELEDKNVLFGYFGGEVHGTIDGRAEEVFGIFSKTLDKVHDEAVEEEARR